MKAEQQENALPNEHINIEDNQEQPVINEIKSNLLVIPYGGSKGDYVIKYIYTLCNDYASCNSI